MRLWGAVVVVVGFAAGEFSLSAETAPRPAFAAAPLDLRLRVGAKGKATSRSLRQRGGACELACHGHPQGDRATTKSKLYAPATSRLDWREYRSRLIKAETPAWMRRTAQRIGVWAHEVKQLERGCLLIETGELLPDVKLEGLDIARVTAEYDGGDLSQALGDTSAACSIEDMERQAVMASRNVKHARVILLLQHDEYGSEGLILNKATGCTIGNFTSKLPLFKDNIIHYGGRGGRGSKGVGGASGQQSKQLHTLHSCRDLEGSQEIVDGVFLGADVKQASALVGMGKVRASDVKFFYSSLAWNRGELEAEMAQGKWVAAACSKDLILKPAQYWEQPLWRLVLEVMGGKFALISRNLCGDLWH